ncbi:hypothetical protein [Nocardia carnea]|uniref:hypothetical protein n=1 Tax=Nocardia carnea TaxID=37328 RepID=UPI00245563D3|nr:hypothetical protein [Nocardia carnea]
MQTQTTTAVPMTLVPEVRAGEYYGHKHESTVSLRGNFRHQGRACDFRVTYYDADTRHVIPSFGTEMEGESAHMVAQSSAFAAMPVDVPDRIEVRDGDLVSICGRVFRICDDRRFADPRLVLVED